MSTMNWKYLHVLLLIVFAIAFVPSAVAQTNYGGIRGVAKDVQGASIQNAQVTITDQDTRVAHTSVTNGEGIYQFSAVSPGTYKVTITVPGFKTYETTGNIVTIGSITTVDAALQIGAASDTVEVTASTLTLDTASASGGQLFHEEQLQDLPNPGRNPFMFAALDANVVTLGDPRYVRAEDSGGSSEVSLAGAPSGSNSYEVDGIPVSTSSGGETFIISPEAAANAKVQVNTYDAEIGRTGGGVFNVTTKSGSTQYHGVLYGESRQPSWAANQWYNFNNSPTPDNSTYLYAGAFGGPLPFMKKIKWLDNTFFWVTEEGYRQGQPLVSSTTTYYVPTAAERGGDFSADAVALYDPTKPFVGGVRACRLSLLGDCGGAGGVGGPNDPLNVTPASYINSIGQYTLNQFPSPTANTTYAAGSNYAVGNVSFKSRSDEYIGKLDHTFAPWWSSSASYVHEGIQEPNISFLRTPLAGGIFRGTRYFDATALNNVFTINSTTLLTVGYGFNREYTYSPPYSIGFNSANGFGGAGFPTSLSSQQGSKTFPAFSFTNVTNAGSLGGSSSGPTVDSSHNWVIMASKTIRRHNVKFGYVYRGFDHTSIPLTGSAGAFTFDGQFSNSSGTSLAANGPAGFADLLMGLPSSATMQINAGTFINKENYHALFAQDDFRLSEKITLNLGLRWEYELGQYEKNNKFNVGFSRTATASYTGAAGSSVNVVGGVEFAGVNGNPVHCCDVSHAKFSPRVGIAYQIFPKTVLHAGFGMFYAPIGLVVPNAGYSQVTSYAPGNTTGAVAVGNNAYLSNPFSSNGATTLLQPSGNSLGILTGIGGAIATIQDKGLQYPLVDQYSLDVQKQLPYDVIMKIAYSGAHAHNFANSVNINQLSDANLRTAAANGTNLSTKVTNPYYATTVGGFPASGVVAQSTVAQAQLLLPFPQFTSVALAESNGFSWYNALAVTAEKQMARSLTVLATYTWSANWDNLYGTASQVFATAGPQDNYNIGGEYARSLNSIPNRFTTAIDYQLPFGRGRKYLKESDGVVGRLVQAVAGGWETNYSWTIQNGVPLSVTQTDLSSATYGTTGVGGSVQRPNLVGDVHDACGSGAPQGRLGTYYTGRTEKPYINPSAFSAALPYTYGNAPRSLPCRAPGANVANASINKTFNAGSHLKVQLRFEAMNVFNTPQFGNPNTTLVVSGNGVTAAPTVAASTGQTLGNLTTTIGYARIIQMGGRISF